MVASWPCALNPHTHEAFGLPQVVPGPELEIKIKHFKGLRTSNLCVEGKGVFTCRSESYQLALNGCELLLDAQEIEHAPPNTFERRYARYAAGRLVGLKTRPLVEITSLYPGESAASVSGPIEPEEYEWLTANLFTPS